MFYDPTCKPKPNVLSLATLIAWLETKDPNEVYDFNDCKGGCLFSQYTIAHGIPYSYNEPAPEWSELHNLYGYVAYGDGAGMETFGAALKRAGVIADPQ